jgi:CDP-4-dehydro-6-deoxyglucose reductase
MSTWLTARIESIEAQTDTLRHIRLSVETDTFDFTPGQFVTFDLPIGEKRLDRWRSYSIASAPTGQPMFELCISRLPGGRAGKYFFDDVEVGTPLKMKKPGGTFILPPPEKAPTLVLICTGTGIAPFRSMIQHIDAHHLWPGYQKVHLIFGCRHVEDILFFDEWQQLAARNPLFIYDICLSRVQHAGTLHGYVHQAYAHYAPHEAPLFMLCGWQAMVDEARTRLQAQGFDESAVRYELYG